MADEHGCANGAALRDLLGGLSEAEQVYAPELVWTAGHVELLKHWPRVSMVGSRDVSADGLKRTRRLARILVEHGVTVVSGLARGVDTMAHASAIEAGGRTIAVLGTPLDQVTPKANEELQATIGRDHLLVSQFAPGSRIYKGNFPRRNRLMALISDASVIVEAGDGSGTLSQGWEAIRLNRTLFIMQSVVERAGLTWPSEMIEYGAQVLSDPQELLDLLPGPIDEDIVRAAL